MNHYVEKTIKEIGGRKKVFIHQNEKTDDEYLKIFVNSKKEIPSVLLIIPKEKS